MYFRILKRIMDIIFVVIGLIMILPLMLVVALTIRITMGSPVFFCQLRPGLHGKPFVIYKFRTMRDLRDEDGNLLSDKQRLTTVGRFLRSTSIDEIPELINVLKGEMSLVGPRPLLMDYLERYSPEQSKRHDVKPGITGWAQINGRNAISWDEKFKYDLWYVENWSLWLDFKILWLTIIKSLRREGINANSNTTMPEFIGSGKHKTF